MEAIRQWLTDWRFWLFLINIAGVCLLKFNDFFHLSRTLGEVKADLKDIKEVQVSHGEAIAEIRGKMDGLQTKTRRVYRRNKA